MLYCFVTRLGGPQVTFVTQAVPLVLNIDSVGEIIEGTVLSLNLQWPSVLRSWAELADQRSCLFPMTPAQTTGQLYVIPIAFIMCILLVTVVHKLWVSTCCARCRAWRQRCRGRCSKAARSAQQSTRNPRFPVKRCVLSATCAA